MLCAVPTGWSVCDLSVCTGVVLHGSVLTLVFGVADGTKSLLAFAVVGQGTGLRSSFVPGSLFGMTSCVSQMSSVPPEDSSIFSSNLVGPYVYLAFDSSLRPILLLSSLGC